MILVGDRIGTLIDHTRIERSKIYHMEHHGVVIGFAGDSYGSRLLAQKIKDSENKGDFAKSYSDSYTALPFLTILLNIIFSVKKRDNE